MKTLEIINLSHEFNDRDAVYGLVDQETKIIYYDHFCSNVWFALGDLISHRPERIEELKKLFSEFEVKHHQGVWKP